MDKYVLLFDADKGFDDFLKIPTAIGVDLRIALSDERVVIANWSGNLKSLDIHETGIEQGWKKNLRRNISDVINCHQGNQIAFSTCNPSGIVFLDALNGSLIDNVDGYDIVSDGNHGVCIIKSIDRKRAVILEDKTQIHTESKLITRCYQADFGFFYSGDARLFCVKEPGVSKPVDILFGLDYQNVADIIHSEEHHCVYVLLGGFESTGDKFNRFGIIKIDEFYQYSVLGKINPPAWQSYFLPVGEEVILINSKLQSFDLSGQLKLDGIFSESLIEMWNARVSKA